MTSIPPDGDNNETSLNPEEFEKRLLEGTAEDAMLSEFLATMIGKLKESAQAASATAASPATPSIYSKQAPRPDSFKTEKEYHAALRKHFDEGFIRIMACLPLNIRDGKSESEALADMRKMISWGVMNGMQVRDLGPGKKSLGMMTFVPEASSLRTGSFVSIHGERDIVLIEPFIVSKTWAGLGAVSAVLYIRDRIAKRKKTGFTAPTEDERYETELGVHQVRSYMLDHLTGGKLYGKIRELVKLHSLKDTKDVINAFGDQKKQKDIMDGLNGIIPDEMESEAESHLREWSFLTWIALDIASEKALVEGVDGKMIMCEALKEVDSYLKESNENEKKKITEQQKSLRKKQEMMLYDGKLGRIRKNFDDAFDDLCDLLPDEAFDDDPLAGLKTVQALRGNVKWVQAQGDSYFNLEGASGDGYMAIIPPGHEILRRFPDLTVKLDATDGNISVLQIGPYAMSKTWAAIELVFGLSIIYARKTGVEPPNPTRHESHEASMIAISNEIRAAELFSKGRLFTTVENIMGRLNLSSAKELIGLMSSRKAKGIIKELDSVVYPHNPLSRAEESLRGGVYVNAMAMQMSFDLSKKTGRNMDELLFEIFEEMRAGR